MVDIDIEAELEVIEDKITEAKKESSEAEGALKAHMKRLKDEFKLSSLEDAEDKIVSLEKEIEKEEAEVMSQFDELKDELGL